MNKIPYNENLLNRQGLFVVLNLLILYLDLYCHDIFHYPTVVLEWLKVDI